VHLRDPDALRDLGLGEVVLEAEAEDQPLALREGGEAAAQGVPDLHELVAMLLGRHGVTVTPFVVVVLPARARSVQRRRLVGGGGLHRLEHVLDRGAHRLGHVTRARRAPEPRR